MTARLLASRRTRRPHRRWCCRPRAPRRCRPGWQLIRASRCRSAGPRVWADLLADVPGCRARRAGATRLGLRVRDRLHQLLRRLLARSRSSSMSLAAWSWYRSDTSRISPASSSWRTRSYPSRECPWRRARRNARFPRAPVQDERCWDRNAPPRLPTRAAGVLQMGQRLGKMKGCSLPSRFSRSGPSTWGMTSPAARLPPSHPRGCPSAR